VLCDLGRYEEALDEGQKAVQVALEVEDAIACIWSYCWVATAYEGLGQYDEAEISYQESLNACRRTINPRGFSGVLGMYANLLGRIAGRNEEALNLVDEALAVMKKHELKQAFGGRTTKQMEALKLSFFQL
jgi:tetratricopeptide (TPR) repeat protein